MPPPDARVHRTEDAPQSFPRAIQQDFFGLHLHRAVADAPETMASVWPAARFGSWRLMAAHVAWSDLEPAPDVWRFERLDSLCALARAHGVTLLYTLGTTPRWASSRPNEPSNFDLGNQAPPTRLSDWERYVDTVAKRYRGRITAYEIWNEPNQAGSFSGTTQQLLELARVANKVVHAVDANAEVTTPSPTGGLRGVAWLADYLDAGGADAADVVAFHFYVSPRSPEAIQALVDSVREVLKLRSLAKMPLWNTETGWLIQNHANRVMPVGPPGTFASRVLDNETSAAYVGRALLVGICSGLARFYWYAWDNRTMGMTEADGQRVKPAGLAYERIVRWTSGARVESCVRRSDGVWTVRLARGGRQYGVVAWSEHGPSQIPMPDGWRSAVRSSLFGPAEAEPAGSGTTLIVGHVPSLFTKDSRPASGRE